MPYENAAQFTKRIAERRKEHVRWSTGVRRSQGLKSKRQVRNRIQELDQEIERLWSSSRPDLYPPNP